MKPRKLVGTAAAASLLLGLSAYAADTASISGKVAFEGTAPKSKKVPTDADPVCAEMHADKPLMTEDVVVNGNGTLRNVFVYVKSGLPADRTFEKPKEPVVLNQEGCQYMPHVFGIMAKQALKIKNSDDTAHNIHYVSENNGEDNFSQPQKGMEKTTALKNPEVMVKFKCDVHPWMAGYAGVLDHPFHSVTGEDGSYSIKALPAGEYEIVAWHEKYGEQSAKVKVGDGESKTADFKFSKPAE